MPKWEGSNRDKAENIAKTWQGPKSICECGHVGDGRWSQHDGSLSILQNGHGQCLEPDCNCQRFTFSDWTAAFRRVLEAAGVL